MLCCDTCLRKLVTNRYNFVKHNKNSHESFMHSTLMHSLEIYYSRTVSENKYEQTSVFLFVLSFVKRLFFFLFFRQHTCLLHVTPICVMHYYICVQLHAIIYCLLHCDPCNLEICNVHQ